MTRPLLALLALWTVVATPLAAEPRHGIAMHGEPVLPSDFKAFPYVDPDAPKGGVVNYALRGTFDSVNTFIVQGQSASGIADPLFGNNVYDTLMARSADEPFTLYPLVAKSVETDEERSFVEFRIDERARFSDGTPLTAADVVFTLELLRDKGWPRYRTTMRKVSRIEIVDGNGVRLTFGEPDRELPLILGLMPVLPKHATDVASFDRSTLKPMIGSGPYRFETIRPGELVTFRRNPDYWAADLPSRRGMNNFDEIRLSYYRDENAMFEAFKKGLVDVNPEGDSGRWLKDYGFQAVADGRVVKDVFTNGLPSGMNGFVLNTRKPLLGDKALRQALIALFDFEWANANLFGGTYARTRSFYDKSELSSHGRPASAVEQTLLAPFASTIQPDIMAGTWKPPVSDGSGRDRAFLRVGHEILARAGYTKRGDALYTPGGERVSFELMLKDKAGESIALAWQRTLRSLGIDLRVRATDDAQYVRRMTSFDFDAVMFRYSSSLSPGVEQVGRWGSVSREAPGSLNYAGVADPAVDAMIDAMLKARGREEFVDIVRAYDRVLLSGAWVVPLYHQPAQWVGRWSHIQRPAVTPIQGYQLSTWWRQP